MKFLILVLIVSFNSFAADNRFPTMPNLKMTPGRLCNQSNEKRYPEKINYCERNVDVYMKDDIIDKYDDELGYKIKSMDRREFKIDHLIPLCAGGANVEQNLWPQHKSVYEITDPIEPVICQKMAEGKILQKEAIQLVIYAKTHLNEVPQLLTKLMAR